MENPAATEKTKIAAHLKCRASTPWTWVFYGDSITHGAAYTNGWRAFPEIFAERLRWEMRFLHDTVINSGISGNTTMSLLNDSQYERRVRRFAPDAVFLMIGMNDTMKLRDTGRFRENLTALVRQIRQDNAIPLLQSCNTIIKQPDNANCMMRYEALPKYNAVIREVAAAESVILIDHDRHWRSRGDNAPPEWMGETIHPGGIGHLELAEEIFRELEIYDENSPCCNVFKINKLTNK